MSQPTHPLLSLVESNRNGLKSIITSYIDATVDSHDNLIKQNIVEMIQSGLIDPQNSDVTAFGTTLPPPIQTNTDQSSAQCLNCNDHLTTQDQTTLQNEVSLFNTINTESMIKQEFDEKEDDEVEIDNDNFVKCEKYERGLCNLVRENKDTTENRDESCDTTQSIVHASLENNQTPQLIISNDILPSPTNPINTEPLIKQEYLQGSSITVPLDVNNNAALNNISIDEQTEQIEGQNTQIQTEEFDDNYNDKVADAYYDGDENEYLNQPNWTNGVCEFDHENNNNHLNDELSDGDGDETNFDEPQLQIVNSVAKNFQVIIQTDKDVINERSVIERNIEQSAPLASRVLISTRKRVQTKVFGDLIQSSVNSCYSRKRNSDLVNRNLKKRKNVLNDGETLETDNNDGHDKVTIEHFDHGQHNSDESMVIQQEERDANNAIGEEIATECTIDPIQPNLHLQCSHCYKSFVERYKLQRHLRVNTGERPFECPQCEKQFTQKQHLDTHLLIHSGDRPFQCRHCEKSFTSSGNRTNHEQAIHLHVKPYRCKQCGHTATRHSDIIRHIRMVHFGLSCTIKEQRALNIVDDRDAGELVEKV